MKFPSFSEFTVKATTAFKRFPLTLTWAIAGSFFVMVIINVDGAKLFKEYLNMLLTLILGISWLISAQFFIEQFKKPEKLWWVKLLMLALLALLYFSLPPHYQDYGKEVPYIRYILYFFAGHIAVLCAPFIMTWHDGAYFNYLKNILIALARSILFSGVLYVGLVLAMLAMVFLFDIDFREERYVQLFVFCLGIVNTWVYLSDFPKNIQFDLKINFDTVISVFVKFILIPLAALYLLILYAYAVKIIIRWELPEGAVSYLIVALSALLFIIQFIVHPVRHTHKSAVIKGFSPFCYWLLLPLLPLLYTAIFRRVADYGITEKRYFLMVLACFITGAAIYLLFSRKKQLRYLPIALIILIFLTSVGPWGAFSVSENSQLAQMERLVNTFAKVKQDQNRQVSDTVNITHEQASRLGSITRYLFDRGKLSQAEAFLGYDPVLKFKKENGYGISDSIIKNMGITVQETENSHTRYLNYYAEQKDIISVKDYDVMKDVYLSSGQSNPIEIYDGFVLSYDLSNQEFILKKDGRSQIEIPLTTLIKKLKSHENNNYTSIEDGDMRITSENNYIKIGLIFKNISFDQLNGRRELKNCQLFILLKIKKIKTDAS
jgi:hypothetical protein